MEAGVANAQTELLKRFGVTISWQGATIEGITTLASEADNLGYGHFWIPEGWGLEALSTTGYLLGVTKKIRVGSGVLNIYSRSAALIGMSCATLEQISPRRFILGIGTSGRALIEDWHGMKFEEPLTRTREYVDIIRKVSRGESVDYSGKTVVVKRFRLFARPVTSQPEIYIAAIGEKNLILAGEIADGTILQMYPMSGLPKALKLLNGKKAFSYYRLSIVDSRQEEKKARFEIARNIAFYVASMGKYYAQNLSRLGYAEDLRKISKTAASSGSKAAAAVVSDELLEELSFIGSPELVLEKISEKIPGGVYPVFDFSAASPTDVSNAVKSLRSIAWLKESMGAARGSDHGLQTSSGQRIAR